MNLHVYHVFMSKEIYLILLGRRTWWNCRCWHWYHAMLFCRFVREAVADSSLPEGGVAKVEWPTCNELSYCPLIYTLIRTSRDPQQQVSWMRNMWYDRTSYIWRASGLFDYLLCMLWKRLCLYMVKVEKDEAADPLHNFISRLEFWCLLSLQWEFGIEIGFLVCGFV